MSLLLALTSTAQPEAPRQTGKPGGVLKKRRRGRLSFDEFNTPEFREEERKPEYAEPNEFLFRTYLERQERLAAQIQALKLEEEQASKREAAAKVAQDLARRVAEEARLVELQMQMQRIAQEIEELDVAYVVALMD